MRAFRATIGCFEQRVCVEAYKPSSIGVVGEPNKGRSLISYHVLYGRYDRSRQEEMAPSFWLERSQPPKDPRSCLCLGIEQFPKSEVLMLRYRSLTILP